MTATPGSRLVERITLFWDYFNSSYLFFAGGSNLLWSTRAAGVFLLAFIPLLLLGAWMLAVRARATFSIVLMIVFVLVPLPSVLAMPEAPFYATARAILGVPFGVLIGEDKAVKWNFHLLASHRLDLWDRSQYLEAEAASRSDIASGSVLILSAGNPRLSRLEGDGWSVATIVRDAAGEPAAAILRKR